MSPKEKVVKLQSLGTHKPNYGFVKALVEKIFCYHPSKSCLYRGTNQVFDGNDQVNSLIYRKFCSGFIPINIEADIVKRARQHFATNDSNIKILTDIRHFGGPTTLIDFSRDLMVALFFACNGNYNCDGQLITLRKKEIPTRNNIGFLGPTHSVSIIEPAITDRNEKRVQSQKSIFVHAPNGFIPDNHWDTHPIPKHEKVNCLSFLKQLLDIDEKYIFNDFHGFLDNFDKKIPALDMFYSGLKYSMERKHHESISCYTKSIKMYPVDSNAYMNRGNEKVRVKEFEDARNDYDIANSLNPNDTSLFINRGNMKSDNGDYKGAIYDYDIALKLKDDNPHAYNCRGYVKVDLGDREGAITDYSCAIELANIRSAYYRNSSRAKEINGDTEEAKTDRDLAIELDEECVTYYINRAYSKEHIGKTEGAIEDFNIVTELGKYCIMYYRGRGCEKKSIGDTDGSKTFYDRANDLNRLILLVIKNRLHAKGKAGNSAKAMNEYDHVRDLK